MIKVVKYKLCVGNHMGEKHMNREEARKRATELVEKMTVEELASQLKFDAPAIERLGIPEYNWWNEGLHGVARAGVAMVRVCWWVSRPSATCTGT